MTYDEFLEKLTALSNESGFVIGGCGCDGSPWVESDNGTVAAYLTYDYERKSYKEDCPYPEPVEVVPIQEKIDREFMESLTT